MKEMPLHDDVRRTITFPRWKCWLASLIGQREIQTATTIIDGYHVRLFTEYFWLNEVRYVSRYYVDRLGRAEGREGR